MNEELEAWIGGRLVVPVVEAGEQLFGLTPAATGMRIHRGTFPIHVVTLAKGRYVTASAIRTLARELEAAS